MPTMLKVLTLLLPLIFSSAPHQTNHPQTPPIKLHHTISLDSQSHWNSHYEGVDNSATFTSNLIFQAIAKLQSTDFTSLYVFTLKTIRLLIEPIFQRNLSPNIKTLFGT